MMRLLKILNLSNNRSALDINYSSATLASAVPIQLSMNGDWNKISILITVVETIVLFEISADAVRVIRIFIICHRLRRVNSEEIRCTGISRFQ